MLYFLYASRSIEILRFSDNVQKKFKSTIRKYHNQTLKTNQRHHEE